ncbi:MAG: FprA family A-type flavoprotein [Candidatus Hydrothermarchaeales archaeon]
MERKITEALYWVGVFLPEKNISLNAFLIKDKKNTLIDTTAPDTADKVIENIKSLIGSENIDYILLTHADVDHAGGLPKILQEYGDAEVITSSNYGEEVIALMGAKPKIRIVDDKDVIDLGERKLSIVSAPFLCTPDSVFYYDETDKVLFSADAFGTYTKEWTLFAEGDMTEDMKTYNEVKFGHLINVTHASINVRKKNLDVDIIAPGHGLMVPDAKKYIEKGILMML